MSQGDVRSMYLVQFTDTLDMRGVKGTTYLTASVATWIFVYDSPTAHIYRVRHTYTHRTMER